MIIKNQSKISENLSQHDQDELNEKLQIREFFNHRQNAICVEVGSNEPISICSQSWHLEEKLGWQCILIEPIPSLAKKTKKYRPNAIIFELACTADKNVSYLDFNIPINEDNFEITGHASLEINADEHNYDDHKTIQVKTDTLTNILKSRKIKKIDFLSIDVEGTEMDVLLGLDFNLYRPNLILLEDKHLYLKKHIFLKKKGYKLAQRLNRNCWYIPNESKFKSNSLIGKIKLIKRMYVSIWYKKILYSFKHRSLTPFKTL